MRTILLASALLASLAAPSFAQGRHHDAVSSRTSDFYGFVQDGGQQTDRTSPHLEDGSSRCAWTAVCGY